MVPATTPQKTQIIHPLFKIKIQPSQKQIYIYWQKVDLIYTIYRFCLHTPPSNQRDGHTDEY